MPRRPDVREGQQKLIPCRRCDVPYPSAVQGDARPTTKWLAPVAACLVLAATLGVASDVGLRLGSVGAFVFTSAAPWVVLAFSAGRTARNLAWAPVTGAVAVLTGLGAYYLWMWWGMGVAVGTLLSDGYNGMVWLAGGVVVGAVAGVIGGLTRVRVRVVSEASWCGVLAVPAVDGILSLLYGQYGHVVMFVGVAGAAVLALATWAVRSSVRLWVLLVGAPVAVLLLWQAELLVLQQVFGRLTWV